MAIAYCPNCDRFLDSEDAVCGHCQDKLDVEPYQVHLLNVLNRISRTLEEILTLKRS